MTVRPRLRGRTAPETTKPSLDVVRAREPFDAFYEREFRSVVGLAYALSGSASSSEDLAQDAFIAAHKNWDTVSAYEKPEAWVRRVVSNMAVSRFRRGITETKALARLGGFRSEVAALPELPDEAERFWANVRKLPRRQAQSLALHYLEDRPVAEIAEILECSPSTVKVHLHKGRKSLAARLGIELGEDR